MGTLLLFVCGAALGGQLNWAIYRWAWNQRPISPWSQAPVGAAPRQALDRVPILGWWALRRESPLHGKLFWLRPMLLELAVACGLPALYRWELAGGQLPLTLQPPDAALLAGLQLRFLVHTVLFALLIIATFIDVDEKTIPDYVTVPGALFALVVAATVPNTLPPIAPPVDVLDPLVTASVMPILVTSPHPMSALVDSPWGLALGLFCWCGWCYGILPKTLTMRKGLAKACAFLVASIRRHPLTKSVLGMTVGGLVAISLVWSTLGGTLAWHALFSSLVGMAFAGGLVWAIRIVSGYVLGVEAMGFGDVTLMAMIGAFLGWQAAMFTFFLAPFTSLAIALGQYLMTGRRDIPFGPFLCAAAAIVVLAWEPLWTRFGVYFELGWIIPGILVVAIALMGVLLAILQGVKRLMGIPGY